MGTPAIGGIMPCKEVNYSTEFTPIIYVKN